MRLALDYSWLAYMYFESILGLNVIAVSLKVLFPQMSDTQTKGDNLIY